MINQPITLPDGLHLKNRLMLAPISALASGESGLVTDEEINYYQLRNQDIGAVVVGSVYVSLDGKAYEYGISASTDAHIGSLSRLAKGIQKKGAKAIIQLYHGGAFTAFYRPEGSLIGCVSPVPAAKHLNQLEHHFVELTDKEILTIISDYKLAAKRAILAGFDGIELHGGNAYLPKQFLSARWNTRHDLWGGTALKRYRFLRYLILEIQEVIREFASKPFALGLRLSLEEGITEQEKIETFQESLDILAYFDKMKLDYFHVVKGDILEKDGQFIQQIKQSVSATPLIVCGNLRTRDELNQALANGVCGVSACRPSVLQPDWSTQIFANQCVTPVGFQPTEANRQKLSISKPLWDSVSNSWDWYRGSYE